MAQPKLARAYNPDGTEPPDGVNYLFAKYKDNGKPFSSVFKYEQFPSAICKEAFRKILNYLGTKDSWEISVIEDIEVLLDEDHRDTRLVLFGKYTFKPVFDAFTENVGLEEWKASIQINERKVIRPQFGQPRRPT